MATITVRNIPDDLNATLKESAVVNHRSINREIIACIERAVAGKRTVDIETFLEQARQLRKKFTGPPLTDEDVTKAKRRPHMIVVDTNVIV